MAPKPHFGKILRHDLAFSRHVSWGKLLVLFAAALAVVWSCLTQVSVLGARLGPLPAPTFSDAMVYIFSGTRIFDPRDGRLFEIPYVWITVHLLTAYIVGDCGSRLITDRRHFEVVFYGSRTAWWAAKCVTALVNVCACYFAVLLAVLASVFLGTSPRFTATPEVQAALLGAPLGLSGIHTALLFLALPFLTSCAVSLLQITLLLWLKPVLSYAAVAALYILSVYFSSPLLFPNGTLPLRSTALPFNGNLSAAWLLFANCAVLAAVLLIGTVKARRLDLI